MGNPVNLFREIIILNELGGDRSIAYRFSDPDGVLTGKSGWSFGCSQFDTQNNPSAILCLRECGFTTDEISGIRRQIIDVLPLVKKLESSSKIIDRYDASQFLECLGQPTQLCRESKIKIEQIEVLYHLADYHNQYYMSRGGKMHRFLQSLEREVTPSDVLEFKLKTAWGLKRPDDVQRRYNNIIQFFL